jgi:hypothetical protein
MFRILDVLLTLLSCVVSLRLASSEENFILQVRTLNSNVTYINGKL